MTVIKQMGGKPATARATNDRAGAAPRRSSGGSATRPVPYEEAVAEMEARVDAIRAGTAPELVWLLEHPPLYTAGTSARAEDLLDPDRFPVHRTGRGGEFTYHGPGQRVAYVMLDLKRRGPDLRRYVHDLEEWLIRTLAQLQRHRRTPRRPRRHLDRPGPPRRPPRPGRQDRRPRRPRPPLGQLPRRVAERGAGPGAFRRDRAVRHRGARGDVAGRSRSAGDDGRCGCGDAGGLG